MTDWGRCGGVAVHGDKLGSVKAPSTPSKPLMRNHFERGLVSCRLQMWRQHRVQLKNAGVITESQSPFESPIVVVRKENGKIRMCVDFRTKPLQCPIPIRSGKN